MRPSPPHSRQGSPSMGPSPRRDVRCRSFRAHARPVAHGGVAPPLRSGARLLRPRPPAWYLGYVGQAWTPLLDASPPAPEPYFPAPSRTFATPKGVETMKVTT